MNSLENDRVKFKKIGKDVRIWPLAKIIAPEVVSIGNAVIIDDFVFIQGGKTTRIGDFVHIASFSSCTGGGKLILDDFSSISSGVRIFTGTDDVSGSTLVNSTVPKKYRKPIRSFAHLKKHSFVGANAVVLPGVTIGEGAVIAPGSVVSSDCLPWTIYVGNPARPIKKRPSKIILKLEKKLRGAFYARHGVYKPRNSNG